MQENTDFHLARSAPSDDSVIADGTFDDHDGVVEASLNFRYELFCAPAEDKGACFCCRAAFEEIEAFAANLAFFEFLAGAEVFGLDVGTGGGDAAACGLDDAFEVVGGDAAGAEDIAVGKVSRNNVNTYCGKAFREQETYCVARSPIGSLLRTTFAPVLYNASILL